ncbi:hypothetical protein KC367_g6764 [Hortaea werneckii]|nr:hypothetical protein KC342_g10616 [Hortaea werneckii]KAI7092964.1 hypothetical protein KC339_g12234 [Hortaea werneckii]KAI7233643.1 hypothetical protein KC365_g6269 [Hortaea werneckii]KAI7310781.1 hypothetical protein KC340_g10368 [Hortaea werneckii]KAI7380998.1 hypothetical protein KC328_g12487 [Hortaea werneckii]
MTSSASKKRSAPATEDSALTAAIKRRRRTDFGNSPMITRSQALSAARNAVLHTTELLENILYFLPMKDLLFAQRVCTKWRELIQRSVPLQEALFFRPRELGVHWKLVEEPEVHPKLVKIVKESWLLHEVFRAAIPNPLLCKIDVLGTRRVNNALGGRPGGIWFRARPSAARPEASWRRMLIAHAPSCFFEYYFEYPRSGAEIETIAFPDDGNAGNVVGFVEEVEAEGRVVEWGGHVLTFRDVIFTTEEELEMDVLE